MAASLDPVRTSPSQEQERAFTVHAQAYGQSSPVSLAKYDPATHSLKIPQLSLFEASPSSLQTLPRWGWMRGGAVWGLMTSAPRTTANGSGYWRTPGAEDGGRRGTYKDQTKMDAQLAKGHMLDLSEQVRWRHLWPTPNVPNGGRTTWHAEQEGHSFYHEGKKVQLGLEQAVRLWATPSARDWRSGLASEATMERNARPLSEQVGGSLNPDWVEAYLMAWPMGWTDGRGPLSPQTFHAWLAVFQTALHG